MSQDERDEILALCQDLKRLQGDMRVLQDALWTVPLGIAFWVVVLVVAVQYGGW